MKGSQEEAKEKFYISVDCRKLTDFKQAKQIETMDKNFT